MVDRLFWRAGFGPTADQRAYWTGARQDDLVDWFLNTPVTLTPTDKPPITVDGKTTDTPPVPFPGDPIDPLASDYELELEWIDRMQRADNPFPDRLAFFWHRHWAISREDGSIPLKFVVDYRNMLLNYAEFGRVGPDVTFKQLALRHDHEERGHVDVPQHLPERQGQAERELRARDHGAVLPRRHGSGRHVQLLADRRLRARAGVHRLDAADQHGGRPTRRTGRSRSRRAASTWRPRRCSPEHRTRRRPRSPRTTRLSNTATQPGVAALGPGLRQRGDRRGPRARQPRAVS